MKKRVIYEYMLTYNILNILVLICAIYSLYTGLSTLMLKEINGELVDVVIQNSNYDYCNRGNVSKRYESITIYYYKYQVRNRTYENTNMSNMIIYPSNEFNKGAIIVYYNYLFPNYSVIIKPTVKYIFYNMIPFILLLLCKMKIESIMNKEDKKEE